MMRTTNRRWNESKETYRLRGKWRQGEERQNEGEEEGKRGGKKGGKGGGKDKLKEQGERFSIPPLPALRLSLEVLIHGFSGL